VEFLASIGHVTGVNDGLLSSLGFQPTCSATIVLLLHTENQNHPSITCVLGFDGGISDDPSSCRP
jgi:hypothetical protein